MAVAKSGKQYLPSTGTNSAAPDKTVSKNLATENCSSALAGEESEWEAVLNLFNHACLHVHLKLRLSDGSNTRKRAARDALFGM